MKTTLDKNLTRWLDRRCHGARIEPIQDYSWSDAPERAAEETRPGARALQYIFSLNYDKALQLESHVVTAIMDLAEGAQVTVVSPAMTSLPDSVAFAVYKSLCDWRIIKSRKTRTALYWDAHVGGSKSAVACGSAGDSAQPPVATFTGKVESIEGKVAHVMLTDDEGREMSAECDAQELAEDGIAQGGRFRCVVARRGRETVLRLEPLPKRQLSVEEWRRLREETADALKDYDPDDDY